MSEPVLDDRALNRALLARQGLLARSAVGAVDVVRGLVGLQAQEPKDPYVALWSRIERFDPASLEQLLVDRAVVRIVSLRGTVHLHTADDALALRALCQPVLDKEITARKDVGPPLAGVDLAPVDAAARAWLAEGPRTMAELRRLIGERFPEVDAAAAAYAMRNRLGLVQVPPRGLWSTSGGVRVATVEDWLGRGLDPAPSLDGAVLRYLRAFGPAAPGDVSAWCRLTGMREVLERLRAAGRVRAWRDDRGRELFDVPDGLFVDPDAPAPVRFLPEYDNVLLAHDDRSRITPTKPWTGMVLDRVGLGHVLVDGFHAAFWHVRDGRLVVEHKAPRWSKRVQSSVAAEGRRLLRFVTGAAGAGDVELRPLAQA